VVLVDGHLTAYLSPDGADFQVFLPDREPDQGRLGRAAARALASGEPDGRVSLGWASANLPAVRGRMAPFLVEAGFQASGPGFRLRPSECKT